MKEKPFGRREFLRRGSLAVAAGAALPLLGSPVRAAADAPADPDQLFQEGWFDAADRGYARQLVQDADNAHALAQRGDIAVLSNRFRDAAKFLTKALQLTPGDTFSRRQLAECYVRQDKFDRAIPQLRQTGNPADTAAATQYAALAEIPYQVRGAESTRVQIVSMDPLPIIEASMNGGAPQPYIFDTGADTVSFDQELADELGLTPVSSITGRSGDGQILTLNLGVLESFRIGDIELRNFPVSWSTATRPTPPNGPVPVGTIGTVLFYHFMTTLDYEGRAFILRRRSEAGLHTFQAAARRNGYRALPLWLAGSHFPCTLGSLNDFGPQVVSMDTGGSRIGISCTEEIARQAGVFVDHDHLTLSNGMMLPSISPDRISLGDAVGRHVPGVVTARLPWDG